MMKLGIFFFAPLVLVACDDGPAKPPGEFDGSFSGAMTLVASGMGVGPAGWSLTQPSTVAIVDPGFDSKTSSKVTITLAAKCVLRAQWSQRAKDTSRGSEVSFLFGDLDIDGGQMCAIGDLTMTTGFGTARVDSGGLLQIDVAGSADQLRQMPTPSSFVDIAFRGDRN